LSINAYDIAVLDRDIPGPSGDAIAASIVNSGSGMPILMLTAANRLTTRPPGSGSAPDDYLTKPFRNCKSRAQAQSTQPQARAQQAARAGDRRPALGPVPP